MKSHNPPVRWNVPINGSPNPSYECKDHPAVRNTHYDEIVSLLKTNGCSRDEPWWTCRVMGIIETSRGKQIVLPGDWIIEPFEGVYYVLSDEQYRKDFAPHDVLGKSLFEKINDSQTQIQIVSVMLLKGTMKQRWDAALEIGLIPRDTPETVENVKYVNDQIALVLHQRGLNE